MFHIKQAKAPSLDPFGRGHLRWIRRIHQSHAVGGANGSTMVVMFGDCCVGGGQHFPYYSYRRNPTGREVFVPTGTLIAIMLLSDDRWKHHLEHLQEFEVQE